MSRIPPEAVMHTMLSCSHRLSRQSSDMILVPLDDDLNGDVWLNHAITLSLFSVLVHSIRNWFIADE
jgi:hypothetical protein